MTIWPDKAEETMWAARKVKYDCVFDCEADNQPSDLEQRVIKLLNDLLFSAQTASCKKRQIWESDVSLSQLLI